MGGTYKAPAATLARALGSLARARRPPAGLAHKSEAGQAHVARGSQFKVVKSKCHCHRSSGSKHATTSSWEAARRRSAGQLERQQLSQGGKGTLAVRGRTTSPSVSQGYREGESPGLRASSGLRQKAEGVPWLGEGQALTGEERETATPWCAELQGAWESNWSVPSPSGQKIFKIRNGLRIKTKSRSSGFRPAWPTH